MLKKKDPSKPFWKRLIKSAEKVKKQIFILFFHYLYFQCQWIVVDWNHFTAEGTHKNINKK
jgi:hypothetical protein